MWIPKSSRKLVNCCDFQNKSITTKTKSATNIPKDIPDDEIDEKTEAPEKVSTVTDCSEENNTTTEASKSSTTTDNPKENRITDTSDKDDGIEECAMKSSITTATWSSFESTTTKATATSII